MSIHKMAIGTDIEEISRFRGLDRVEDKIFLGKVFTEREQKYCFSYESPAPHLAARFVAKEAIIKAISDLNKKTPYINQIEIINNKAGSPQVTIAGYDIKISLSHCKNLAIACAIVTKKKND